jgi:hypothetical protein
MISYYFLASMGVISSLLIYSVILNIKINKDNKKIRKSLSDLSDSVFTQEDLNELTGEVKNLRRDFYSKKEFSGKLGSAEKLKLRQTQKTTHSPEDDYALRLQI